MTISWKTGNTGWYIGGGTAALLMILLAESSTPPRTEIAIPYTNTIQKDFRPILKNIKTIPEYLIDEKTKRQMLLVKHLSGAPEPTDGPMATLSQMEEVRTTYLDQLDISAVEIPAAWDSDWLLEIVQQDSSVDYAVMNYSRKSVPDSLPSGTRPNDPGFGDQTNLHDPNNDVDVDAPEAWAYTTGSDSVVVVVADGEFDVSNPELRPNLWVNSSETAGNGIDDDSNGCTDDIHGCRITVLNPIFGSDIFGNGNFGNEAGHGTRVASVLGARGNNNNEIAGVAWNIRMMFLHDNLSVFGHQYILTMRNRGVNIRVVNYSQCCTAHRSCDPNNLSNNERMDRTAMEMLGAAGILVVVSMGNSGINYNSRPKRLRTPACYNLDNIIAVAGQSKTARERWVDTPDVRASNYGDIIADLYAPAEDIPTSPRQTVPSIIGPLVVDPDGTSHAAPHVAAAAALLWSFKPDLTVTQVRSALLGTVDRFDSFKLKDENGVPTTDTVASGGALNIANALYSVATPGIRIHSSQTTIAEGTSGYIDLSLTREPVRPSSGEVVVLQGDAIPRSDATAVVTPSTLTFTSANWHIPQRMTVRAAGTSGSEITLEVSVNQYLSTTHYEGISSEATMTLQSDGIRPTLHIPSRIAEGDTATATIRFSDPLIKTAQFTITATGTATGGADYTLPGAITAATDANSVTFAIPTTTDNTYEPDETIHLQITTPESSISPRTLQATLTIEDSDTPIMTVTVLPDVIFQSSQTATAQTATATITLDRPAIADAPFFLDAGTIYGHDTSHLMNHLTGAVWPTSATIATGETSTEIIIHSIDEDDEPSLFQRITLSLDIPPGTAARLGTPHRARLRVWDDDGNVGLYLRVRVFMEGAVSTTPTDTSQPNP